MLDCKLLQNARIAPQCLFVFLQYRCIYADTFFLSNISLVLPKL